MKIESELKDEIEMLKDKDKELTLIESKLEVYKAKLREIPELKNKLAQLMKQNIEFEDI